MPVTSYGPWPTTEEQSHPPLVPRYFPGVPPVGAGAAPTGHFAPVDGPADDLSWSDDAHGPSTVELPAVTGAVDQQAATDVADRQAPPAPPPVFVDASGRRQRRIRRLGAVLAVPAGGYLVLLGSTLLGGPTVNAPFLPLPQPPAPTAPASAATPSEAPSDPPEAADRPSAPPAVAPAARRTDTGSAGDHRPQANGAPSPGGSGTGTPGAADTGSPDPVTVPTSAPKPTPAAPSGRGRPTTPPGNSGNKPVKP
ncbi:hypothetical protein ACIRST_09205 [Kitasatospora sp. NPDC101447]|uniref:hypothetical protein n=1 Tax=Kitasatospora sp. NPDC101447 TaxID=3364102 RepID=UPI003812DA4E